ncbi:hypothetical protein PI95_008365 [Hassallia byssoidea VB512170]|uniref:Uncharacterized protein n=1 Tax=Hassallia byssoidea VB512170 TaxID=1304833 RepID=A0A846H7H3_9CYAN|nr:hypothetical protein [Hassalia byssoidea]NEU72580.1 hypothetical protein [Hassalia byssoidea VB512170]
MNSDANKNIEVIVEVSPQTNEMVEREMAGETDDLKHETKELIEALKRRAQAEAESAGTLTRETYLNAIRKAREAVEGERVIERDRIERSWATIQEEADRNWQMFWKEVSQLGDRFGDAAKAAWDAFNAPRP